MRSPRRHRRFSLYDWSRLPSWRHRAKETLRPDRYVGEAVSRAGGGFHVPCFWMLPWFLPVPPRPVVIRLAQPGVRTITVVHRDAAAATLCALGLLLGPLVPTPPSET